MYEIIGVASEISMASWYFLQVTSLKNLLKICLPLSKPKRSYKLVDDKTMLELKLWTRSVISRMWRLEYVLHTRDAPGLRTRRISDNDLEMSSQEHNLGFTIS